MTSENELYETVMENARHRNGQCGGDEIKPFDFDVFDRYHQWCKARGLTSLPMQRMNVVAFLLSRAAEGANDGRLSTEMSLISRFHHLATSEAGRKYGDTNIGRVALKDFYRAVSFAAPFVRDKVSAHDLKQASRSKAYAMFPEGSVPMRWSDAIAA